MTGRAPRDTSAGSAAPTGGESAPPVVRRSEAPGDTLATDPSSEIAVSALASTGDTSSLVEQPTVRDLVLAALSGTDKRLLLEGGTPRHELSGTSGPLRPEVMLRRREILVVQYTPAAWRSQVAWHSYWDQHGGFAGANLENEQLMADSPSTPRSQHRKVRVAWGQARKWVRAQAASHVADINASREHVGPRPIARWRCRPSVPNAARARLDRPATTRPVRVPARAPEPGRPEVGVDQRDGTGVRRHDPRGPRRRHAPRRRCRHPGEASGWRA